MRVVYLNPVSELGGGELSLLDLVSAIKQAGDDIEPYLIVGADGPLAARARTLPVPVHILPLPPSLATLGDSAISGAASLPSFGARLIPAVPAAFTYVRRLRRLLADLHPDIIHSNAIKMHLLSALAKPPGVPLVWHVRDYLSSRAMMSKVLARAAGGVSCAIAISEAIRVDARTLFPALPVRTIYNAIDVDRFCPGAADASAWDTQADVEACPPDTIRVGMVATYARWKGQLLFLRAARELTNRRPDLTVRYYIVGGPIYRTAGSQFSVDELRQAIEAMGLRDRVTLIPFQPEPAAVYRMLDIVVHASTRPEPFGRTIAEAMACGRPLIVSAEGGAAELFRDGQEAIGFRPRDPQHLAETIEKLATDSALAGRLGETARRAAVERFAKPRLAAEVVALYDELTPGLRRHTNQA